MNARAWFYGQSFHSNGLAGDFDDRIQSWIDAQAAARRTTVVERWDETTQSWKEHIVVLDSEAK